MDRPELEQKPSRWKLALLDLASIIAWCAICFLLVYLFRKV